MKLSDVILNQERILKLMMVDLAKVKSNIYRYIKTLEDDREATLSLVGSMNEDLTLEEEDDFYRLIQQIDGIKLSLRKLHHKNQSAKKDWFSDDEVDKETIYKVKDE